MANKLEMWRGERCLCSDLSFALKSGQLLLIRGPNGSGKSTLIRVLIGLGLLEAGEVLWNGKSIYKAGADYRAGLAYMGHSSGIKAGLTPLENLHAALALSPYPPRLAPLVALQRVELARFSNIPCRALSAGQQRRVGLARLLSTRAHLWFLDEPLTSLDVDGVKMVEAVLAQHIGDGGLAAVATHQALDVKSASITTVDMGDPPA